MQEIIFFMLFYQLFNYYSHLRFSLNVLLLLLSVADKREIFIEKRNYTYRESVLFHCLFFEERMLFGRIQKQSGYVISLTRCLKLKYFKLMFWTR